MSEAAHIANAGADTPLQPEICRSCGAFVDSPRAAYCGACGQDTAPHPLFAFLALLAHAQLPGAASTIVGLASLIYFAVAMQKVVGPRW